MSQSTVSRALEAKGKENVDFLKEDGGRLLHSFFQEERGRYSDLLQEEWSHYYGIPSNNVSGRNRALAVIRATLGSMSQMAGRLVAEIDEVENRRELDKLEEIVERLKQKHQRPTVPATTETSPVA